MLAQGRALKSSQARQGLQEGVTGLSPGCHLGDSPESIPVTLAGTVLVWLALASQGAGCGQDCSAGGGCMRMREQQCPGDAVGGGTHLCFPRVQVTQRKQPQNGRSWHVPAASLGTGPSALRLSPLLSQAALGSSSAEEWSSLTHLEKKKKRTRETNVLCSSKTQNRSCFLPGKRKFSAPH